jgi:hypothetical protein
VQYTEDKTIIDRVAELHTLIDQHVENFYRSNGVPAGGMQDGELDDPATRYGIIRYRIARAIIEDIIMWPSERYSGHPRNPPTPPSPADRDQRSDTDVQHIAARLSSQFHYYAMADSNNAREAHLYDLCYLGVELWRLMSASPSTWGFGEWETPKSRLGLIVVFPTLLQDDEQAAPRRIFRI